MHDGKTLPECHPLISGDKNSVHDAGVSVKFFALSEEYIHPEQLVDFCHGIVMIWSNFKRSSREITCR